MLDNSVRISGNAPLTDNYAGYLGGGMEVDGCCMGITAIVSLTNNWSCWWRD